MTMSKESGMLKNKKTEYSLDQLKNSILEPMIEHPCPIHRYLKLLLRNSKRLARQDMLDAVIKSCFVVCEKLWVFLQQAQQNVS